ncbi:glucan 1,3-beta-glucosidase, partial [Escherichia coli]
VSYSPYFRAGVTPLDPNTQIPPEWIDTDLQALAKITRCVRTYSVDQGLDRVPEFPARHGLTVWLGAWIGRDDKKNAQELARAIALANQYR